MHLSSFPVRATCVAHLVFLYLITAVQTEQLLVMQSSRASSFSLKPIGLCSPLMRDTACHTHAAQQAQLHLITRYVIPIMPISLSLQTLHLVMQSQNKMRRSKTTA
jgi:hypothetical protein